MVHKRLDRETDEGLASAAVFAHLLVAAGFGQRRPWPGRLVRRLQPRRPRGVLARAAQVVAHQQPALPDVGQGRAHHLLHGAELGGERARLLPRQVDVWQGATQLAGGLRAGRADVALQQAHRRLSSPHFAAGDEAAEAWWPPRASPAEIHSV